MPVTIETRAESFDAGRIGGRALTGVALRYGLALSYAFALCYAYDVLSRWWAYFGFTYKLDIDVLRYAACFAAAGPAILLSPRPTTFAEAAAWFLYVLVFLPCLLVPVMQFSSGLDHLATVFGATMVACVLFLVLVRGEVRRVTLPDVSPRLFWGTLGSAWLVMMLLVGISFGASFQFAGADDIYDQRFAGAAVAANPAVRYSIALLSSAIDPFLIAYGLYSRRYWIVGIGIVSQVFLFGTLAAKSVFLSPLFVIGVYLLSTRDGAMRGPFLLAGLIAVFLMTYPLLTLYNPLGGGADQLISLLYMRTLLISGAAYGVYEQFFSLYPNTLFSNNNVIGLFISYPYGDLSVGQVVQQFLIPISGPDIPELNANFLATDGMASLGTTGVPLASAASALILRLMSRFIPRERTMLTVAAGTGFLLSLANTSLSTSLITGGGLVVILLTCLVPARQD